MTGQRKLNTQVRLRVAIAATAVLCLALPAGSTASGPRLTISPEAHTPAVSPQTQISILGVPKASINSVTVTGESSGAHSGHLEGYSGDRGASFILDQPLTQGEKVDLAVRVQGHDPVSYSFTVANLGPPQPPLTLTQTQPDKLHHWISRPDLIPPLIGINKTSPKTRGDGKVLLTPLPSPVVHPESNNSITIHPVGPGGPMIVDPQGRVVWFRQLTPPDVAANLRVQRYEGKRVLTWWQGTVTPTAFGVGEGIIANHAYHTVATVHAGNGYPMDIHEFSLTPSGDALFTIYSPILVHLPGTPTGTQSKLMDAMVQEVDVKTGLVVWEWHAYGNIPLSESYANPQNSASFDAYHINSVQPVPGGRVLISARDTSAVYLIDQAKGRILWKLGGKDSTFSLSDNSMFHFQHDAQLLPGGRVSMFDDEAGPPQFAPSSRGLVLKLSDDGDSANVVRSYRRPQDTSAQSEGSVQTLPSGRVFLGFGAEPNFSEFSPAGKLLFDGSLPKDDGSYRVYREPWRGRPNTKPQAVAVAHGSEDRIYVSWNGATNVSRWQFLAGDDAGSLSTVKTKRSGGFETHADLPSGAAVYAARALGPQGHPLGTSSPIPAP